VEVLEEDEEKQMDDDAENNVTNYREVGHNIYILAHQVFIDCLCETEIVWGLMSHSTVIGLITQW